MGRIIIATPRRSDAGVIAAGSEAPAMPAANLLRLQPGEAWRAEDLAAAWVTLDLGAPALINLVALLYTNASASAAWRVRGADTDAELTGAPGYDSGWLGHWPTPGLESWRDAFPGFTHAYLWLGGSPQSYRWWRIGVDDPANPDGFYQAGRLYIADAWQPTRNLSYGWSTGWVDPSETIRAASGAGFSTARRRYRELRFALDFLAEDEMYAQAAAIDRLRGASKDVFVIPNPDNPARFMDQAVYGLMKDLGPIVQSSFNIFRKRYLIEELLP